MKRILPALAISAAVIGFTAPAAFASCPHLIVNPCDSNNPVTKRIPVVWYTVGEVVPCPDGPFYIVATNGRKWHDANKHWDWSRIHPGTRFRLKNSYMDDNGVLHGDVVWPWEN